MLTTSYFMLEAARKPRTVSSRPNLAQDMAMAAKKTPDDSMLAHIERQNALLNADPKAISIQSNRLQADFDTIRSLVTDATYSPAEEDSETAIQAILAKKPIQEPVGEISDWDFWQAIVEDYATATAKLPHLLAAKLKHGGIPHPIRGVIWQSMAQSSSEDLEATYARLSEDSSSYERVIQRDLSRTFPQLEMFKADGGEGQLAMGRLLKAYSLYDEYVGYCQGLGFVVGPLLMTMTEKQAFCVFVRLMEKYELRTMFTLNMEGLHLRLHQFQTIFTQLCPRLDAHFTEHGIHPAMYASQWYLTLFAYSFPISLVLRIYDLVFAEGAVETITRVAIAILQKNEDTLLELDNFEELMMYLSSRKIYEVAYQSDPEPVIMDAMALSTVITKQSFIQATKKRTWFPWASKRTSQQPSSEEPDGAEMQIKWLQQANEALMQENEELKAKAEAAKQTAMDLQWEKIQSPPLASTDSYQAKYFESDIRCRELEKLLAEAKLKLAQYESGQATPRSSSQHSRPSLHSQRNSFTEEPKSRRGSVYNRLMSAIHTETRAS